VRIVRDKWVICDDSGSGTVGQWDSGTVGQWDSGTVGQWVETGVCQGDVKLTREVYTFINNANSGLRQGSVRVM
jgi:hypothetical protein